jgi:hypothetical protein
MTVRLLVLHGDTINGDNGPADAPWTDEILTRNGYVWRSGLYIKEAAKSLVKTQVV